MRRLFLFGLTVFLALSGHARVTTLTGVERSFAGSSLALKTYTDQIVGTEQTIATAEADSAGNFAFSFDINETLQLFIPTETFNAFIYVEPGKSYRVTLPARQERTLHQKLDPFFKPADILLNIEELKQDELNAQLMQFEDAFDFYSMKHLVYGAKVDSVLHSISEMRSIFPDLVYNDFANEFMEYRFLLLLNMAPQVYQDSIIVRLNDMGVNTQNPAFWDIFNNLFTDFIKQNSYDREQYIAFQRVVDEENVKMYFALLKNRYGIRNPMLRELVAIKWLYDLLNVPEFSRNKVMDMLQKLGGGIKEEENRALLTYIINHTPFNLIGEEAPDFTARTVDGKIKRLSDFRGKHIYLNICNTVLEQTQRDLNVLTRFYDEYKGDLQIINLCLFDNTLSMKPLADRYKGKMEFLLADDPDEIKLNYNIKGVPSFILLDPDGKFLMTQGVEPNEELRMLLQRIMNIRR